LPRYLRLFVDLETAGGIWIVLLVTAAGTFRRLASPVVLVLWALLLAHLGLYAVIFLVTPWDLNVLLPMVGPKLLMHAAPAGVLLIALHLMTSRRAALVPSPGTPGEG
jgi:hypothetical protein